MFVEAVMTSITADAMPRPARAHSVREFSCPTCGDVFSRVDHLSRHLRSHNRERPFVCPACNKGFTRADSLSRHCRSHDGNLDPNLSNHRHLSARVSSACQKCSSSKLRCDGADPCGRCRDKQLHCTYVRRSRHRLRKGPLPSSLDNIQTFNHDSDEEASKSESSQLDASITIQTDGVQNMDYLALNTLSQAAMQARTPPISNNDSEIRPMQVSSFIQTVTPSSTGSFPDMVNKTMENCQVNATNAHGYNLNTDPMSPPRSNITQEIEGDWPAGDRFNHMPFKEPNMDGLDDHTSEATNFNELGFDSIWGNEFDITDWTTLDCSLLNEVPATYMQFDHAHHDACVPPQMVNPAGQLGDAFAESSERNSSIYYPVHLSRRQAIAATLADDTSHLQSRPNNELASSMNLSVNKYPTMLPTQGDGEPSADLQNQRRTDLERPPEQWPTDWEPRKSDNAVSFPDLHGTPLGIFEAENYAHVPQVDKNIHGSFVNCVIEMRDKQQVFRPFLDSAPPSLEAFNCFVQLYFEYFQPIFPIMHQATFDPSTTPWVLVLALAAIGCRYSKIKDSARCATALEELLRRAIQHSCELDNSLARKIWVAQAMVLNTLGMLYSGDKRLLELSLVAKSGMTTTCRRNNSLKQEAHSTTIDENLKGSRLDTAWKLWAREESYRRLGFCSWLIDCQLPLYFDINPSMGINEIQQQLPCKEALWDAPDAETWKTLFLQEYRLGPIPNMHIALKSLSTDMTISPTIGDFGRLILVHAVHQTNFEMRQQARNPLLWTSPIVYNENSFEAWQGIARSTLDVLESPLTNAPQSSILNLNIRAHVHHVALLVHVPLGVLLAYAGSQATNNTINKAHEELNKWMKEDCGRTARHAIMHASILFSLIRREPCRGLHEPVTLLLATLTLWAYHQVSQQQGTWKINDDARDTVRLDRIQQTQSARAWIENGEELRGYLTDVGNICAPGAGKRLLQLSCRTLATMDAWSLSQGFLNVLTTLQMRLVGPHGH